MEISPLALCVCMYNVFMYDFNWVTKLDHSAIGLMFYIMVKCDKIMKKFQAQRHEHEEWDC